MTRRWLQGVVSLGAVTLLAGTPVEVRAQVVNVSDLFELMDFGRDRGLGVAPIYHGWEPNDDETVSMYFGYMNRNWKEAVDIPVGPNSLFEPGPQDRGQPAHFRPRQHQKVFRIVVPKDFSGEFVWTLSSRGRTERVKATLHPTLEIFFAAHPQNPNRPPRITSIGGDQVIAPHQPATLRVSVVDDGLPNSQFLGVNWYKYRGPGQVTLSDPTPSIHNGVAVTTATFSEPGVYMMQVVADDGSRTTPISACCWTTAVMTVTVSTDTGKF